ncbi:hypothetical protein CL659_01275 [bacterium]|nr:hypothetical protein [bacterium]|tara:strand:- start:36165 stop:38126 length:1962 start_codon:yes stop_codon:yes gene_type:complete
MRWNQVKAIFIKDGTELIRDIRTIIAMVILPAVFVPLFLLIAGIQEAQTSNKRLEENYTIGVTESFSNEIPFESEENNVEFKKISKSDLLDALKSKNIDAYIELNNDEFEIHFDGARSDGRSQRAKTLLEDYVKNWNLEKIKNTLKANNIAEEILNPPDIKIINIAPEEEISGFELAQFLPLIVLLMVINLLAHPAIDSMTGERERGTAESLLALPITSKEIIFGKFLVIASLAIFAIALNIGLLMLSINIISQGQMGLSFYSHFLLTVLGSIPMIIFFSGALLYIAGSSKSTKEASSYLHPFVLIFMIGAFLSLSTDSPSSWMNWIPGIGAGISLKSWLTASGTLISWISAAWTTFLGFVFLNLAAEQFKSENTILGVGGINWKQWWNKQRKGERYATSSESIISFILIFIAFAIFSFVFEARLSPSMSEGKSILYGTFLAQITALVMLPHFINKFLGLKNDYITSLKRFQPKPWLFFISIGAWLFGMLFGYIGESIWPMGEEFTKIMQMIFDENSLISLLFIVAVMPGIAEELVFRGFLLHGFKKLGNSRAILISSSLFALMHLDPSRFLYTFVLGVIFAMITLRTGTIWYSALMHCLVNAISIMLAKNNLFGDVLSPEAPTNLLPFAIMGLIGFLIIKSLWKKIPIHENK